MAFSGSPADLRRRAFWFCVALVPILVLIVVVNPIQRVLDWRNPPEPPGPVPPALVGPFLPPGPERQADVPENLLDAIARGLALMEDARLDREKCGGAGEGWKRCLGDYLLVAADAEGKLETVEVYQDTESSPPGFRVDVEDDTRRVGVNVPFTVVSPPGWTVVALRTAVLSATGPDGIEGASYVPYSSRLDTPEMRRAGQSYLVSAIQEATTQLQKNRVKSQHFRGKLVTEIGTPEHILALILTEQMHNDVGFVKGGSALRLAMLNRTLAIIGANQEGSYRYTRSRVGAAGIGQIMPKTYRNLREIYPGADLPDDAVDGRVDHVSALKAMIVHTDNEWWAFGKSSEKEHKAWLVEHLDLQRLVLAAGYNANIATVDTAIHACVETWRDDTCEEMPGETRRYMVKYEWVNRLLFDASFRAKIETETHPPARVAEGTQNAAD